VDSVKSDEEKLRALLTGIRGTILVARNDDERQLLDLLAAMKAEANTNQLQGALDALRAFKKDVKR